jgi:hypothetical protein
LGQGGREVDVPLLAGLALDDLDFGGKSHRKASFEYLVNILDIKVRSFLQGKTSPEVLSS